MKVPLQITPSAPEQKKVPTYQHVGLDEVLQAMWESKHISYKCTHGTQSEGKKSKGEEIAEYKTSDE